MSAKEELIEKFGPKIDQPELIKACEQITKIFAISVEDLYINWESFVVTKHDGLKLEYTPENLTGLQTYIQGNLEKKRAQGGNAPSTVKLNRKINLNNTSSPFNFLPSTPTVLKKKQKLNNSDSHTPIRKLVSPKGDALKESSNLQSTNGSTPLKNTLSTTTTDTPTPLKSSSQVSGDIIETLNSNIPISEGFTPDLDSENPVKLIANFDPKKYQFRTMRTKLLETADVLDEQIDSFTKIVQSHYNIPTSEFNNPSIISQSEIIAVGRIVPDNPLTPTDMVLNADSLALETSRTLGIGRRVQLDLSNLTSYSFFPGQIVALKGKNASGEFFKINEVLDLPYLGSSISSQSELRSYNEKLENDLKCIVTMGPYTSSKDLNFEHLTKLVEMINHEIKPHVVIMFGPFVDISHPLVSSGDMDPVNDNSANTENIKKVNTLDDIFKNIISPILKKINNKIQVVLIPSLKDAVSKHSAYPQDSLDRKNLLLTKNFKAFPNPSIFQFNETLIGVSNNDIFKDLKDVNKGNFMKENRFDRISNHIIQQRRFYPSFPGAKMLRKKQNVGEDEEEFDYVPTSELDVSYLGLSEFGDVIPDILIMPSELRFFARVVKNVLVINPGPFMRPNNLGTYAQITIKKPNVEDLTKVDDNGEELYLHDIWNRARVDIVKT